MEDFLIVGIGASAGGIQALKGFFEHTPADTGAAYVVILHLSPNHDSQLAQLLQGVTSMPVRQVTGKTRIRPNEVYVIPPDMHLIMEDGAITPSPNTRLEERRAPVDIFFRSVADAHGSRAIGVILSGTGANGSMGIKRIKERGGAVLVQSPREAEFNEMPRNAIATDQVDAVLSVAGIPARILQYRDALGTVHIPEDAIQQDEEEQQALREIFTQLRLRTGHDFSNYKRTTLMRRIKRRMAIHTFAQLPEYAALVTAQPEETQALLKDLLISVTNFFRDKPAFELLEKEVMPALFKEKGAEDQVRIWVAGCATGEEAYSLAILAAEQTLGRTDKPKVQLFATDIDESAIAVAREGYYSLNDTADISPERLSRFFNREGEGYRIRREIRELVLFANHNFIKDPPFSHIDLVSCRNVLIYLNRIAQERVMETFHFALEPAGFLLLGTSESVDMASDLYRIFSREQHVFQSRQVPVKPFIIPESVPALRLDTAPTPLPRKKGGNGRAASELHLRLLESYAPPSLVVNEDHEIVHLSRHAGRYLRLSAGEPTRHLLRLIRDELRSELRSALYQAQQKNIPVTAFGLKVRMEEGIETVNIQVRPVPGNEESAKDFLLVVFEPGNAPAGAAVAARTSDEPTGHHLEDEVARLKALLRASNEQHEFHVEELKAGNEELQAMNEELRSATEELETSKEELQSMNEELSTVNQELKVKVEEASLVGTNLQNLINSTDIGTIFLDRSFRVILFTPAARTVFNLITADYGRQLSDITSRLLDNSLLEDARTVLEQLQPIAREARSTNGHVYLVRLTPYRTEEDRIQGVVISFVDITEHKRTEEDLRRHREHQAYLLRLNNALRPLNSPERIRETATRMVGVQLAADRAIYAEHAWKEEKDYWLVENGYHRPEYPLQDGLYPLEEFWEAYELFKGKAVTVTRVADDEHIAPEAKTALAAAAVAAYAAVPLMRNGKCIALLALHQATPRNWTDEELSLIRETAELIREAVERSHTEVALSESEQNYRQLFNSIPAAVYACNADATLSYYNARAVELWGREPDRYDMAWALCGAWRAYLPDGTRLSPEDAPMAGVLATGEPVVNRELEIERPDYSRIHILINITARRGAAGNITGAINIFQDITERRQREEAQRESEERFRVTMESAIDYAIINTDIKGRIEGWSRGAERIFGWSEAEALGRNADIIFTPEDRASGAPEREIATAAAEGLAPDERWHNRRDGSRFFMSGVMRPIFSGDTLRGFVKIARDLTGRQQAEEALRLSEERYRVALQSAEMAAWDWDIINDRIIWNEQHFVMLGLPPDTLQKTVAYFTQFIHPADRTLVEAALQEAVERTGIYHASYRIIRRDNQEVRWMSGYGRVIERNDGHAVRMIGVMYDITDQKVLEQHKDAFVGIASHELKTPVTSIKAYAEVLHEIFTEAGDTVSAELMSKLDKQVDRLTELIHVLLDATRITEGQLKLQKETFAMDELIRDTAEIMQRTTTTHKLVLRLGDGGSRVLADRERIRQVLLNFISNAIKYSPAANQVLITTFRDGDDVIVAVTDYGVGIAADVQKSIFGRFFRVVHPDKATFPGLGLGLYISADIIHRHEGRIWVSSTKDEGATFYFRLAVVPGSGVNEALS